MKLLTMPMPLLLAGILLLATKDATAQNRFGGATQQNQSQQNQQGGFGQGVQRSFGSSPQSGQGPGRQPSGGLQGGNRQDNFVGSDVQQIRNQQQNRTQNQARRAMFNFAIESFNEMRESRRQQSGGGNQKPPVRVQLRPLFAVSQPSARELTARANSQFNKALPSTVAETRISVSAGIATISGTVKTEYDKQLAAKMLSLQPGIAQVENRLTIEPVQAAPLLLPVR